MSTYKESVAQRDRVLLRLGFIFVNAIFLPPPGISCIAVVMLLGYAAEGSSDWKASKSWSQWSLQSYGAPEDPEW